MKKNNSFDCHCSRRQFLKQSATSIVSLLCLQLVSPVLLSCSKYTEDSTNNVASTETGITYDSTTANLTIPFSSTQGTILQSTGGFVTINSVDSTNIYVMLANINGTVVAFSSRCPHANVYNRWSFNSNQFVCGSHNSIFDSDGSFSSSSSTSGVNDLSEYSVTVSSSTYIVDLS